MIEKQIFLFLLSLNPLVRIKSLSAMLISRNINIFICESLSKRFRELSHLTKQPRLQRFLPLCYFYRFSYFI